MKIVKREDAFGLSVFVEENDKYLCFTFGGNGDLYWSIRNPGNSGREYSSDILNITKENYKLYHLFEMLFNDIENINIFDDGEELSEERKNLFTEYNYANYNELYNKEDGVITWYSDEVAREVANYLKIYKEDDLFRVEFNTQKPIEGYDRDFHSSSYIPIRFRNSGSRYFPFNCVFMRMYNNMKNLDDVNDIGHQIHMEEYLYNIDKQKRLIKTKNN